MKPADLLRLGALAAIWGASHPRRFSPRSAVRSGSAAPFLGALPPVEAFSTQIVVALLGVSLLCSALGFLLYFRLIADLGPTRASPVTFLIPVFGVL